MREGNCVTHTLLRLPRRYAPRNDEKSGRLLRRFASRNDEKSGRLPRRYAPRNDEKSGRLPRRYAPRNDEKSGRLPRRYASRNDARKRRALAMTQGKRGGSQCLKGRGGALAVTCGKDEGDGLRKKGRGILNKFKRLRYKLALLLLVKERVGCV